MYLFLVFVLLGMLAIGGQAAADRAIPPMDPPKTEGMMTQAAPDSETESLQQTTEDLPDYRGAQKPDLPKAKQTETPPAGQP
ncbi:MAG TPA: hypothetical protein VHP34_08655 [Alphaproteobacteria bacterium]|nr:hypothetical protein [Alphaproteobacteria bacterium]